MEFRLLGPLEVRDADAVVPIGGPKQRTVLALLLLNVNRVVTVERLTDAVWASEPPETARNTLQTYVRHLRKALGAERIEHRSSGYVLVADPDEVDLLRFERLVEEARRLATSDLPGAAATLREALGLWRGPALDDLSGQPSLDPEIAHLEESRMAALEERIAADLALGRHPGLVPELETLVGTHPFRERLWGHLMVALYRSGRQGDALAAFQRARTLLVDELGIDPSPELRLLEERILRQDPALEAAGEPLRGYRLIERIGAGRHGVVSRAHQPQVGREVAIKAIHRELANDPAFVRRFEHEAAAVARLEHPHVVPLYDYWRDPDGAYLVMRFLLGGSLRARLEREGPLAPEEAARILEQVAQALDTAHRRGIVHGEVTPENVLFDEDGNAYLSDFQIAGPASTPSSDVDALGSLLREAIGTRPDLPPAVEAVLGRTTEEAPERRFEDALSVAAAFRHALETGRAAATGRAIEVTNPYKGLRPFDEPDADDFFGRERMVERVVTRMAEDADGSRFVAVVGPSGSGKSSLVRAGVIPALRRGALPGSATWFVTELTPGPQPFEALEAALLRVAVDPPSAGLAELLRRDERGLMLALDRILPPDGTTELVLLVDQLEELFTQTASEDERSAFLRAIAHATTQPGSRLRAIVALRADFYDRPLLDARFGPLLAARTQAVVPMTAEELERAVAAPAERVGVSLEPGLVAELVRDAGDHAGALPLLQYALTELFDRHEDGVMTVAAYRAVGGVAGALAGRAEDLFSALDDEGREACRQLFLRLVALGEGAEDTRRRVLRSELGGLEFDRGTMDAVIEAFGRHRLVSFDRDVATREPTVELAHEALIHAWERYRGWVDEAREDVRTHRRLAAAAEEWVASGMEPSFLLSGARLERVAAWTSESHVALGGQERRFVEESLGRHEAAVESERERIERERSLERRSVRRMRVLVGVLAAASIVASALTVIAANRSAEAERRRDEAVIAGLTGDVLSLLRSDPELGLALALRAVDLSASIDAPVPTETVQALHWAIQEARIGYPAADGPTAVVAGPFGTRGVLDLPLPQLAEHARSHAPPLTPAACERYLGGICPALAPAERAGVRAEPLAPTDRVSAGPPLSGTEVTVLYGAQQDPEMLEPFRRELDRFTAATGIEVRTVDFPEIQAWITSELAEGDPPDVAFTSPGSVIDLGRQGHLVDLGAFLDRERLTSDQSPYLVSLGTLGTDGSWPADDGRMYGAFAKLNLKSLVWFPEPEFREAGYRVPRTLGELARLEDRIRRDGRTPWCMGLESASADGWPGTDWIENLVLAEAGLDAYDRWAFHEMPFDSPVVRDAFARWGDVVFGDGTVLGGPGGALDTPFAEAQWPMLSREPRCWLYLQADFATAFIPEGSDGVTTDAFAFPPATRDAPTLVGGGEMVSAFSDRPEVRELIRFLVGPEFGADLAASDVGFFSANRRFDGERYPPHLRERAGDLSAALAADTFRFDASDLMPPAIGAGAFWDAIVRYVAEGPGSLDRILAEIDAAWPDDG